MAITKTGKKKDGLTQYRVRVSYRDRSGAYKQVERTAYGRDEAMQLEHELTLEYSKSPSDSRITVNELYTEYITAKAQEVRESSLAKTQQILSTKVIPYLGDMRVSKLDKRCLQKWKTDIYNLGLSSVTSQNIYGELRAMLNYAVKMDYLQKNPLTALGNFKAANFEKPQDKIHYYTVEQFKKYIAVAKEHCNTLTDWGYYVFFNIAFYTGMRKGEINALKWSDIDGNVLHVRRSVAQKIKGKSIVETPPKNQSSYRDLQIPVPLMKILDEHRRRQAAEKNFTDDFRVCGGISCLSDTSLSNKNTAFAKEANLPYIRIHDFRHSHATLLANEGINIQEVARRLGHSNIEMTWNTYSHLYPREEERALQVLNKII